MRHKEHHEFFTNDLTDWTLRNLRHQRTHSIKDPPWATTFSIACWKIWQWRNKSLFEGINPWPKRAATWIHLFAQEEHKSWSKIHTLQHPSKCLSTQALSWRSPPRGTIKINVDGSAYGNPGHIACGGVLRDDSGSWLFGFACNLGFGSITLAEIWGAYYGLQTALNKNYDRVTLSCDSQVVVSLLRQRSTEFHPFKPILEACRNIISQFQACEIRHDYRETNKVADGLANLGHGLQFGLHGYDQPPTSISSLLLYDNIGGISWRKVDEGYTPL